METQDNTQSTEAFTKVEWSEPKVSWVKPELICIEGVINIDGKMVSAVEHNAAYGLLS